MEIFNLIYKTFINIWTLLFNTYTLFGVSIGMILLGVSVAYVLWNIVMLALGISTADFSSLQKPKDYYNRKKNEKEAYQRAESRFRASHDGKLVSRSKN